MDLSPALQIVRLTDTGKCRDHNEDAVASDAEMGVLVLADGMGGYKAGEVASQIAVLTIVAELKQAMQEPEGGRLEVQKPSQLLPDLPVPDLLVSDILATSLLEPSARHAPANMQIERQLLLDAVEYANTSIFNVSQTHAQCAGMGTTLVLAMFSDDRLLVGHIGDSRMYRYRAGQLTQLTQDHSVLQEQLKLGLITPEQAAWSDNRHLVTRALGIMPSVELELHEHDVMANDLYLLCSDGLTDEVDDHEISAVLRDVNDEFNSDLGTLDQARDPTSGELPKAVGNHSLQGAAQQLISMANEHGGKDNISVILARITQPYPAAQAWYNKMLHWLK